ncbi:unnamed protein product [Ceratitis capitata]|uniref:(Mediterranean fruit fly) hypothetical protein n=2 Tax=Ceratitis capitata TaxID=7213 RepID=A0A811V471_CERCA|nr:unnamed protein product [Ceratitis capitata]
MQQDDDAHSAISNGSRVATGDIDPGEETETAPEAEAEDDSVTRCICDLTHDDGYMICCDKCSVWQHVDCMGIDRQNIPDEYQCEVCQPRAVDKARARSLQLMKRKEQTQLLLSAQSAHATGSSGAYMSGAGVANLSSNYQLTEGQRQQGGINTNSFPMSDGTMHGLPNNAALATTKKGKVLKKTAKDTASGKKSKKADKLGAGGIGGKPPRKESGASKKTTKRKTKSGDGLSASASAAEKHAANLRQWIENYELAVTNHYSPELRARLHAITKQPSLLQSILNTENRALKECCNNGLESRATTVPHAGGKILISNMDIGPSCPIFELRGKYMLSPQYKTQNASVNMNSPPPTNYLAATLKAHKTPGPFIFFYQLPDAEAPMQTMNQDGSYPPLPPQPAYLKGPEICVDTRTYGNEARFVRRSCRPNAEIQHLFEKGTIHLFIVATTRIRASTEITIKHEPHDLLAIENKKATASNCIVQPTSTACACGLLKDCLFGPPPTQQSLSAAGGTKSRKSSLSTTLNGGVQLSSSAAAMQLTMGGLPTGAGKKKGPAQNINRNRSTSSSGDSSIGAIAAAATAGMNSPNVVLPSAAMNMSASATSNSNVCSNTYKSNGGLNILSAHALVTSASAPSTNGGNMSATSSISSVMHDSGICTSSSSPSVSIPSPTTTLHLHSPTQQPTQQQTQQQQQQQQQQTVPASTTNVQPRGANSGNALITPHSPQQQQQHQQILGALPTPLLLSPPPQMTQTQLQVQQQQHITVNNSHTPLLQEVVSNVDPKPALLTQSLSQAPQQPQEQPVLAQMSHRELIRGPTISDASLAAAAALQSLNTAVTLTSSNAPVVAPNAAPSNTNNNIVIITPEAAAMRPAISTVDTSNAEQQQQHQQQPQQPQHQHQSEYVQQQQTQLLVAPKMQSTHPDIEDGNMPDSQQQQQLQLPQIPAGTVELPPPIHTHTPASAPTLSPNAGSKSPQKHSGPASINTFAPTNSSARSHKTSTSKTPSSRSTSFSEDDHQQQHNVSSGSVNDDVTATAKSSSKEKPKLSREDRKMEAILRAIEKMERNQQRKSQQNKAGGGGSASSSAAKRRNSNSNSPSTPCKRSISELSTSASSGRVSSVNARKKKRKTHKSYSGHSAQARKRRKSRVNSGNESADGAGHSGGLGGDIGVTNVFDGNGCGMTDGNMQSEAESASLLSPAVSLTTTAPNYQMSGASEQHNEVAVDATAPPPTNEDQAAGLLLAFANPNLKMSPTSHLTTHVLSPTAQQQQQYATQYGLEQLKSPQHRTPVGGSGNATSPPATPVSSACLLIEAAVGPLQEHMDGSSPSSEFKYPNKTKTKKVLMSNWLLNQVDADTSGSDSPPPNAPTPPPTNSGVEQAVATITAALPAPLIPTAATLSLDSLVQAATMCDFANKQQSEADVVHPTHYVAPNMEMCSAPMPVDDEPQNLSMAAQKVEEFIQQTERGTSVPYTTQPNLTGVSSSQRHLLHLPLQVSTCSNNSSVKKRWLRQAISEETTTDESMTPTPTAAAAGLQTASPTTATAHLNAVLNVPNGFTTPLKKRRLIISGGVKEEEDIGGNTAPSPAVVDGGNFFESPAVKAEPTAMLATPKDEHDMTTVKVLTTAAGNNAVDVMNVQEISRTLKNEVETSIEEETDEEDYDEEEERDDVDVVGDVGVSELRTSTSTTAAHTVSESMKREVVKKEDSLRGDAEPIEYKGEDLKAEPMSIDQDDDVDILRSPSPGHQQMLAAEDNLVKIEPEDTSGGDVKIDVEREESLAGDRFEEMVLMHVKKEEALVEGAQQLSAVVAAEETKPSLQEDEKNIKSSLPEPNDNAMDQKPYEQLPSMFEENEKHKKEESEVPNFENITKTEPHNAMDVETSSAHLSSAVANSDDESMMTIPPKPSPLKLLTLDGSRSTCIPTSDEPLKKRPKLDSSLAATTSSQSEVPQTQTSLLKPLSARMLDMAKPSVVNSASGGNNNNSKNEIASTQANTLPTKSLLKSAAAKKPTVQHSVVASPPSNCMTFLAAAAAAAIERKPPPPPPPPPASVATISPTKSDVPASTTATTPVVEGINNNNNNNNTPAAPFVPNTTALEATTNAGVGSTALAPRKQNATTNNNNSNERKIPLTDDDIQARLHSFHKENILILQSRNNKKSKTNATAATTTVGAGSANELVKNVKLSENKSSHHSHHHSHDAVKSSSGSKHNSTSKSLSNSSSGSSGKKLHKKDRSGKEHSSSSSRSSSSHSGKLSGSSSSSRKSSSSHKKDHASGKTSSGNTTPVLTTKQQTQICNTNSSSNTSAGSDSKERLDDRRDIDKNRGGDKERHHNRHRTTSSSSSSNANNTPATPAAIPATPPTAPTAPPTTFKKRQLNFEQELTKDLPLVNAATLNINRHRKDSGSRDSRDDLLSSSCSSNSNSSLVAARKRRESSSSSSGGSRNRHNSTSSSSGIATLEQQKDVAAVPVAVPVTHKPAATEHNGILTNAHVTALPPPTYVREHVAIPHFNNVVVSGPPPPMMAAYFSGIGAVPGGSVDPSMGTPIATYVPTPALPPSAGIAQPSPTHNHSLLKNLPMQPVLSHLAAAVHGPVPATLPASSGGVNVSVLTPPPPPQTSATVVPPAAHSPGASSNSTTASTYNSIYGKLRDTSPVIAAPTSGVSVAPPTPLNPVVGAQAQTAGTSANLSLSEYLDTKVKSYSTTLGSYVSQTHAFVAGGGAGNATSLLQSVGKTSNNNSNNTAPSVSSSSVGVDTVSAVSAVLESPVVSKLPAPLKLPLTRTASHDPRLNPQLNAPEPPPAPKRKLSINEYRKRMQLSSDSATPSTPEPPTVSSTPTTTPSGAGNMSSNSLNNSFVQAYNSIVNASPEEMARQLSSSPSSSLALNKYTLNSPEHKRRHSGSEKEQQQKGHGANYDDAVTGLLNSSTGSSSLSDISLTNHEDEGRKGQFSAAPTLLEKQQESLCERLKLLRNKNKSVTTLSSAASEFANLKKDCDRYVNRTNSISSTDNLDNCLEEISSSSSSSSASSRTSSREPSPERNVVSNNLSSVCKRATSATSSTNHKWLHDTDAIKSSSGASKTGTPTRDDVSVTRCGSGSESTT